MKVAVLAAHGVAPEIRRVDRPEPGPGQVLVRVRASGVNPLDAKLFAGQAAHARHPLPAVLGIDLAGDVESVGPGVTAFRPGDAVFGMTGGVGGVQGSLAEYAAVDERLIARKPANLAMRDAATLPLVFITAWEALVDQARVKPGDRVLLQGAGGVGRVGIEIARARGARVFAVDSGARAALIERLGATPIDRTTSVEDYVRRWTDGHGFDVVFDTAGGQALDASFAAVRRGGHVVSALGWGSHSLAPLSFRAATYSGVFTLLPLLTGEGRAHHGEILREAAALVEAGQVAPRADARSFTLETVVDAYRLVRDGGVPDKLVVDL